MNAPSDTTAVRNAAFQSLLAERAFTSGLRAIEYRYQLEQGWTIGVAFEVFAKTTSSVTSMVNYILTSVHRHARAEAGERFIGPRGPRGKNGEVQRVREASLDTTIGHDDNISLYDLVASTLTADLADEDKSYRDEWRTSDCPAAHRARAWFASLPVHYKDVAELLLDGHSREEIVALARVGDKRVRQVCNQLLGDDGGDEQLDLFQGNAR